MKAMIFAAGLGTRLRPLTDTRPKALVNVEATVGGKRVSEPLLWWVLKRLRDAGIDELVVNVHHFAPLVREWVVSESGFSASVRFSDESECLLDTGGGILKALPLLLDNYDGPFLVHNVDIVSNLDYRAFTALPMDGILARLVVCDSPSDRRLLFDASMRLVGWTNLKTGEIKGPAALMTEPARKELRPYSFTGIHLISSDIAKAFSGFEHDSDVFGIIDFYLAVCSKYPIFGFLREDFEFVDAGTVGSLSDAGKLLDGLKL
ncbi:MAG: NTP transferase domain-containing protein [Bacteroidales bacterium]|nr:NTP transferase domain-containing protein [Bacteroidales bacterium]